MAILASGGCSKNAVSVVDQDETSSEDESVRSAPKAADSDEIAANREEKDGNPNRARELIEGYLRNRAKFQTLRVVEHRVEKVTEHSLLSFANHYEKSGADPGLSDEEKAAHLKNAQHFRNAADKQPVPKHYHQDFWTDRVRIQSRSPRGIVDPSLWRFSDNDVTPESLASTYKDYTIYSFLPSSKPPLRIWAGYQGKGETVAIVSSSKDYENRRVFWFPPLCDDMDDQNTAKRHPIDSFFADPIDQITVVGEEKLGDVATIVVRSVRFVNTGLKSDSGEELQQMRIAKTWIDPLHGCLPRRIEVRGGLALGERRSQGGLIRTATVSSVRKIDGAGYYPIEGTIEEYITDPNWKEPFQSPIEWMKGKSQQVPMVVGTSTQWTVERIEANREMSDEMFALPFPDGVAILDSVSGRTKTALPPKPAVKAGAPAPDWKVAGWTDGRERKVSDYGGQVLVIDFWGKWCRPCLAGIPTMNRLKKKYRDQDVSFLAIHTAGPDIDEVRRVAEQHEFTLVSAVDEGPFRDAGETAHRYGCRGFPTYIVIKRDGTVSFNSGDVPNDPEARQKAMQHWQEKYQRIAAKLDIAWPLDKDVTRDELLSKLGRIYEQALIEEIDKALGVNE